MLRVIEEAKPNFVIWENVQGAISTGALLTVLSGLCQAGDRFDAEILSAAEIRLDHKRGGMHPEGNRSATSFVFGITTERRAILMPRPRKQTNLVALPSTQVSTFVRSLEAEECLQCSSDRLIAHIPFWQYGIHYRDMRKPTSSKADYRWNIKAIEEWFNTPPELRKHKTTNSKVR